MKFFYPDSLDLVDPEFDFTSEEHSTHRVRHRDDVFAHELLEEAPYHGLLLSRSMVYGTGGNQRYRQSQRFRLLRTGAHHFFETDRTPNAPLQIMGDCGAYAYVERETPPVTVDEVLDFYESCCCDYVLSVDHVIPGFLTERQKSEGKSIPEEWRQRQEISLSYARSFLKEHQARGHSSVPIGIAQGWDGDSYAQAVEALQKMGYDYVALGGLASLATENIASTVERVSGVLREGTRVHLLGVSRAREFRRFQNWGVASFDSTMPLRQAFMDDKHNYHTPEKNYLAIRLPKVTGSTQLQKKVNEEKISASEAFEHEQKCLRALRRFDRNKASVEEVLDRVREYELLFNGRDQTDKYRELLEDHPWKHCDCTVCRRLGIDVTLLRGKERNKRRGFHNMRVLFEKVVPVLQGG